MKYYTAIKILFISSIFIVMFVLYFANITRTIEKDNNSLLKNIKFIKEQININQVEFTLYNSYEYLKKMHKVYLNDVDDYNIKNVVSFSEIKNNNFEDLHFVGIK